MFRSFRTRTIGQARGSRVTSEICELAVAKGKVSSSIIPSTDVLILRSMYCPGHPVMYRVAYLVAKENNQWEIADVTEKDLVPSVRPIILNTGDF
jgi:hypothetical protein